MTDHKKPGVAFWVTVALVVAILFVPIISVPMPYMLWAVGMQICIMFKYRPAEFALLVAISWAIVFAVRWAIKR